MKKVVCLLMAIAMIFSCLSIGNVFAEAESIGVKFVADSDMSISSQGVTRAALGLTTADVVDGKITVEYTIVNPNDYDTEVMVYLQDGWNTMSTIAPMFNRIVIAAKSEETITLVADVVDGKIPYGSANAELSAIVLRIDIIGRVDKDDFIIVKCPAGDPVESAEGNAVWGGALVKFEKATEADLPKESRPIGVKYVATTDVSFSFTRVNLGLTAQDVVNNEISVSYKVINPNDYEVEVNLHLQNDWDVMSAVGADDNKKVMIPAFGEETITLKQTVTDGVVNYTKQDGSGSAASAPLSAITLRVDCSSTLKKDDFFILECDANDPINSMQTNPELWGGLTIAVATEDDLPFILPRFEDFSVEVISIQ